MEENGIGLEKTIYQEGEFKRIGLDEEETKSLSGLLRGGHKLQMKQCIEDAIDVLEHFDGDIPDKNRVITVAVAFFERQALSSFTMYQEALGRKVHEIKSNGNGNGGNHD